MEKLNDTDLKQFVNFTYFYGDTNSGPIASDVLIFAWTSLSIIILGLIGNFVTILIITCAKNQQTPIFYAIRSLAISDFVLLLFNLISWILILTKENNGTLYTTAGIILTVSLINSSFNVLFLFFLRYALIVHPLKCRQYLTNSFVISASLALWVHSAVFYWLAYSLLLYFENKYKIGIYIANVLILTVLVTVPSIVISILHCLKMRRLQSTTVSPAITRRMSWFICVIVLLNGILQFCIFFILIWRELFYLTVSVIVMFIHSCNPYMFFLFHFSCSPLKECCKNSS